jgi:hypothetical protein
MELRKRCETTKLLEHNRLASFEIHVFISTVSFLRGSQNAGQKLVKSFGLLGLRTPPHGLNLQRNGQNHSMATSHVWKEVSTPHERHVQASTIPSFCFAAKP